MYTDRSRSRLPITTKIRNSPEHLTVPRDSELGVPLKIYD